MAKLAFTLIIAVVICFCFVSKSLAFSWFEEDRKGKDMSGIYNVITSQSGWLNTERALQPEDLKGRIILLDFWTYCCINCMHVIPELQALEAHFGDDLTVIGVHSAKFQNEKDTANIRQAILRYDIEHPVVNDFDFSIWQQFGVRAWPTLVLINPQGRIERVFSGEGNGAAIQEEVEALREEYAGNYVSGHLPIALEADKAPDSVLEFPGKLAWADDVAGQSTLFISDTNHHRILGVNPKTGEITLEIGKEEAGFSDGDFASARFRYPQGIVYGNRAIYVADTLNHAIRKIDLNTKQVSTVAGTGKQGYNRTAHNADALSTAMASPWDVEFYPDENHLAIAMAGTHQLWTLDLLQNTVSILAGNGRESIDDGKLPFNSLSQPSGLSKLGNKLYFVDSETSSLRVLENGVVTTLIGTGLFDFGYKEGTRSNALMQHTIGVYADETGIYMADTYNHAIRRYDANKGMLYNLAGTGEDGDENGTLGQARFYEPNDILRVGDRFYVADTNNHQIRIIENNKVSNLMIIPSMQKNEPVYTSLLPNPLALDTQNIQPQKAALTLTLPEGWKINEDAPSYLALFEKKGENYQFISQLDRDALIAGNEHFTGAEAGKTYHLQGTLYYCRKDNTGSCLLVSPEGEITADKDGQNKLHITVK